MTAVTTTLSPDPILAIRGRAGIYILIRIRVARVCSVSPILSGFPRLSMPAVGVGGLVGQCIFLHEWHNAQEVRRVETAREQSAIFPVHDAHGIGLSDHCLCVAVEIHLSGVAVKSSVCNHHVDLLWRQWILVRAVRSLAQHAQTPRPPRIVDYAHYKFLDGTGRNQIRVPERACNLHAGHGLGSRSLHNDRVEMVVQFFAESTFR